MKPVFRFPMSSAPMARWPVSAQRSFGASLALAMAIFAGCSSVDLTDKTPRPPAVTAPVAEPAGSFSQARTARDYRQDAARHLYARQADRIYKGRLPPMLYAVGVLHVDIDRRGQVLALQWQRAPRHAPEVMAEIEKIVRSAAPYPVPQHLAKVTYTDVWLWHKSGRFQLDTLTEGQD